MSSLRACLGIIVLGIFLHVGSVHAQFRPVRNYEPSPDDKVADGRVVRLYVVNDYQRWQMFDKKGKSVHDLERHSATVMDQVTKYYKFARFNELIRVVFVGQMTITDDDPEESFRNNTQIDGSDSLLWKFRDWGNKYTKFPDHDIVALFSGKDFDGNVIGAAPMGALLNPGAYFVAEVYDTNKTEYTADTVAHGLGHTLTLAHDEGTDCELMCPDVKVINQLRPFSEITISRMDKCLKDNGENWKKPAYVAKSECGNGIREYGEECDCGREDCIGFDNCCDGRTCTITRYNCPKVTDMSQLSPVFPIVVAVITALLFAGVLYESGSFRALRKNTIRVIKYPYRQQKKFRKNLKNVGRGNGNAERKEDY
eukprot:19951_1